MTESSEQDPGIGRSRLDSTGEFFSVGAPLHAVRAGYVRRRADELLYEAAIAGRYAHVIAPGRCGKSSLIAATAARLENNGVSVAVLDLAQIGAREGAQDEGRWYYNVAYRLLRQLRIRYDLQSWWQDKSMLSNRQRLVELFSEVILENVENSIVVFIDEMQCITELASADQLLASVRTAHTARVTDPDFNRLTFILAGECDVNQLVDEAEASPFNISQAVSIDDFSRKDLQLFATELNLGSAEASEALDRIYFWTRGQPYLTQKLARAVSRDAKPGNVNSEVDRIVAQQLIGKSALNNEPHLSHMHRQIVVHGKVREGMLNMYGRIRKGITVQADLGSALQRRLMAVGLLEVDEAGDLRVRNRVYESVFTARWANDNMRTQWRTPALVAAVLLLVVALPFSYTQLLPKPFARVLSSPATSLSTAESSWQNLRTFPGHEVAADQLFRYYLSQAAERSDNAGEILSIAGLAELLPDAGTLPLQLQADFWDRRVKNAAGLERRDEALLASIEALVFSTGERRNRAAALLGRDYPLLKATLNPEQVTDLILDTEDWLVTSMIDSKLHQWRYEPSGWTRRQPWSLTALEVRPLVRRVVVDQAGTTRRVGLTVNISHPRLRDLRARLIAPSGRAVEIKFDRDRASANDDLKVPAAVLQALVGESLTGTWSLSLRDEATGVAGHLVGWNLSLNGQGLEEGFQRGISIPDPLERETDRFWTSNDGRFAVARAAQSDSARLWSLYFAKPFATIPISESERLVGLNPGADRLVTATLESVNIWDTNTGARISSLPVGLGSNMAALTRDRRHLLVQRHGDFETEFELWDLETQALLTNFTVAGMPGLVAVDAAGQRLAVADYDRAVRVWDFRTGELLAQMDLPLQPTRIELDAGGQTLAALFGSAGMSVWQVDRAEQPMLEEYDEGAWQFRFSPSGARMVAGRPRSGFQVYSTDSGALIGPPIGLLDGPELAVDEFRLFFGKDENVLATTGPGGGLRLWQLPAASNLVPRVEQHTVWPPAGDAIVAALPDASALAIADRAGHVHLLPIDGEAEASAATGEEISFLGHSRPVRALAASPDGALLASAATDNTIRVWTSDDGRPKPFIASFPGSPVDRLSFSPSGRLLGVLANNRAHILDTSNGESVLDLELGATHGALGFAGEDRLYIGSDSGAVRVIVRDNVTGWSVQHLWQGSSAIRHLAVAPRGDSLVIVDDDHRVQRFNLAEGRLGSMSVQLPSPVKSVAFSPGGRRVLFLTSRWVHRTGVSADGLIWLEAMLVPKPLNGASVVFGDTKVLSQRDGSEFYLPVARGGLAHLLHFRFDDAMGAGLFGNREELLDLWRHRLGVSAGGPVAQTVPDDTLIP